MNAWHDFMTATIDEAIRYLTRPSYEKIDHKVCRTRLEQLKWNNVLDQFYKKNKDLFSDPG